MERSTEAAGAAQSAIIAALGSRPTIDPPAELERRVRFLVDYLAHTGAKGFVLGISGGQDSTLAGRLAQLAVERAREGGAEATFVAVRLPYGVQHDEDDAQLALDFIRADREVTVDVKPGVDALEASVEAAIGEVTDYHKGNVKARARMIAQYAIGGQLGLLVLGTDHAAEAVTGFYTKFGDGGADLLPLAGLTKSQGRELLQQLDAPERLRTKPPTADLLDDKPGQLDTHELGLTYEQIDAFLEGQPVPDEVAEQITTRYERTEHKRRVPVTPDDEWWRSPAGPLFD
ncbi:ammonia-dependent NAD(+) synthetase [Agrococcus lahaulensis]|uniref:ammonia-dependent NAD(+) synthetase n=1 Tax=Agrococcus sp. BE272 TaxID=2817727 RepID=UPI000FE2B374|nr:ammonia-dependent NAD(+) synthetase [Agrococcus sp. BE272]MDR7233762.1 NAD+ synthase [Agrococcus sp. BE272]RWR17981.1 ammonia-dependent NAD(+) synthetase [Agrococcus lahaulensis]